MSKRYWLETLGCPKNQVDSDKLEGTLLAAGYEAAPGPGEAELVVVNTCAFIEDARAESVEAVLGLAEDRAEGAELVVTGCLAERAGAELAEAIPEIDRVAPFGMDLLGRFGAVDTGAPGPPETSGSVTDTVSVTLGPSRLGGSSSGVVVPDMDLLELPRPPSTSPWAYVKIAEGCDRACGFCAIPSFRGPQRSRTIESILAEVDVLARSNRSSGREGGGEDATLRAREIVLVAQDLAAYGRDQGIGQRDIIPLLTAVSQRVDWVRLLYLYPSDLTEALIDAILSTGVPYFDLSLQHTSRPVLRRMKRWGDGEHEPQHQEAPGAQPIVVEHHGERHRRRCDPGQRHQIGGGQQRRWTEPFGMFAGLRFSQRLVTHRYGRSPARPPSRALRRRQRELPAANRPSDLPEPR